MFNSAAAYEKPARAKMASEQDGTEQNIQAEEQAPQVLSLSEKLLSSLKFEGDASAHATPLANYLIQFSKLLSGQDASSDIDILDEPFLRGRAETHHVLLAIAEVCFAT